ncbi:MAG TPA: nuclear transport factor 2 family protein [Gemmatimonadales bacterium]|nr:nuclear transport factor 2 family protein [Gemmatimonadales bacterium]
MKTKFFALFALIASPLHAQDAAEKDAVLKVVNQLFDGMRKHDSAMVRGAFATEGRLLSISEKDGSLRIITPEQFATAVGRAAGTQPWNEPIYDPEVRIDARVATVWAWYDFLAGDKWSHCGIDAFQLAKLAEGWKITQLVDTRYQTGCKTPAAPK